LCFCSEEHLSSAFHFNGARQLKEQFFFCFGKERKEKMKHTHSKQKK